MTHIFIYFLHIVSVFSPGFVWTEGPSWPTGPNGESVNRWLKDKQLTKSFHLVVRLTIVELNWFFKTWILHKIVPKFCGEFCILPIHVRKCAKLIFV